MRALGIVLAGLGLSPLLLTAIAMIKAFNTQTTVDEQSIHWSLTLTACGIPLLICGIVLQLIAAFKKSRAGRT